MPRGRYDDDDEDFRDHEPRGGYGRDRDDDRGHDREDDRDREPPVDDDDFLDLPEDVRERLTSRVNAEKARYGSRLHNTLRNAGIDLSRDEVAIVDPNRFGERFGGLFNGRADASDQRGARQEAPEEPEEEKLGEMPDPYENAAEFQSWLDKRDELKERKTRKQLTDELAPVISTVQNGRVREAIDTALPYLERGGFGHITDHPDFDQAFKQGLQTLQIPLNMWDDPRTLMRVAAFVAPDLMPDVFETNPRARREERYSERDRREREREPRRRRYDDDEDEYEARREREGRRTRRDDIARSSVGRAGLVSLSSSRGTRQRDETRRVTEVDRETERRTGVGARYATALDDPTGASYRRLRDQRERDADGRGSRGGRR